MNENIMRKTKYSFALAGFGYHLYVGLTIMYLTIFFTDAVGISPAAVGTLFLVARIWDAVNDPIMGMIVDRTPHGKLGKFRKYLLITPIPLAVLFVLCFYNPQLSGNGNLIYAYIVYILYGMAYTIFEVPYWGFSSVLTKNSSERNSLISVTKALQVVGIYIPVVLAIPVVNALGQEDINHGWLLTAMIIGVFGLITTSLPGINIKEPKISSDKKQNTLKDTINVIKNNKPLRILSIAYIPLSVATLTAGLGIYFWTYNLKKPELFAIAMLVSAVFTIIASAATPIFIRVMGDKKKLLIIVSLIVVITNIVFFIIGYNSIFVVIAVSVLMGVFAEGIPMVVLQIMFADCIEVNELENGARNEGTVFAIKSFLEKIRATVGGAGAAYILAFADYIPNTIQSQSTLTILFSSLVIIPAIGFGLFIVTMYFYPLSDKEYSAVTKKLANRRS